MIECKSLEEALAVPGVIHIESGAKVIAYVAGDELPDYCKTDAEKGIVAAPEVDKLAALEARVAALESKG